MINTFNFDISILVISFLFFNNKYRIGDITMSNEIHEALLKLKKEIKLLHKDLQEIFYIKRRLPNGWHVIEKRKKS